MTPEQIGDMLRDVKRVEDGAWEAAILDLCCYVRAMVAEVEKLQARCKALVAEVKKLQGKRLAVWSEKKQAYVDEDGCLIADKFGQPM